MSDLIKIFALHTAILVLTYCIFYFTGTYEFLPDQGNVIQWDAGGYLDLKNNSYVFSPDGYSNSGFYPLFAYLWRWSHLSNTGICLLNYLFFLGGIGILANAFKPSKEFIWLSLSIPSLFFIYVPYSEAMFFFTCCILLFSLHENNVLIASIAIFIAGLIRPTAVFFIPSILFLQLIDKESSSIKKHLTYLTAAVLAYFTVVWWQWLETGVYFAHYQAQSTFWHRTFHLPKWPFISPLDPDLMFLDHSALYIACIVVSIAGIMCWQRFSGRSSAIGKPLRFSIAFLITSFLYLLCYHTPGENTFLTSLNRYIFAVPFFTILLWAYGTSTFKRNYTIALFIAIPLCFMQVAGFIGNILYFLLLSTVISLYLFINNGKIRKYIWIPLYVMNVLLQTYAFHAFLHRTWIG